MDTSGFYSRAHLLRAGKFVYGPGFTLVREEAHLYSYPVAGWWWFESAEEAAAAFEVPVALLNLDLPVTESE